MAIRQMNVLTAEHVNRNVRIMLSMKAALNGALLTEIQLKAIIH